MLGDRGGWSRPAAAGTLAGLLTAAGWLNLCALGSSARWRSPTRGVAAWAGRAHAAIGAGDPVAARQRGRRAGSTDRGAVVRTATRERGDEPARARLAAAACAGRGSADRHGRGRLSDPGGGGELDRDRFERLVEDGAGAISRGDWELACGRLREALSLWRGPPLSDFRVRLVRAGGDRPPGRAARRRGRAADRGGTGARAGGAGDRRSRAADARAPLPGAAARPADARAVPDGPAGRRARRLPGGATDAGARSSGSSRRPSCASSSRRSCATTRRFDAGSAGAAGSRRAICRSRPRRSSAAPASSPRSTALLRGKRIRRLLTLTGAGGSGKTRLALRVARGVRRGVSRRGLVRWVCGHHRS